MKSKDLVINLKKIMNNIGDLNGPQFEPANKDIPRIYLTGNGNFLPKTKDNVTMQMKYVSETLTFDCWITIKCQGTSSMAYDKKNFSIRLYEDENLSKKLKMDFKNWGSQYKFVLKANYIDLSHARNIVSARLWSKCVKVRSNFDTLPELLKEAPNLGAIDGFFVKVYYDGEYQGRYTFNIPKDPWMTNMDENNERHCLLCAEDYGSSCFRAPAIIDESDWTDEIHDSCPQSILTKWNEIINFVMTSSDIDFKNNLHVYFDIQSLIDYYCFQHITCGLDSLGKNQVYITYDGNLWLATAYDMDSTWGLYWDGATMVSPAYRMQADYEVGVHGTSNLLYDRLEKLFKQEIYDRYTVLRKGPLTTSSIVLEFEKFMEICDESMAKEDCAIFPNIPGQNINNLQQIRSFIIDRSRYSDDYMEALVAEEVKANKLYELPQETNFNGISDYIDTGVKLFDTAKDFTIIVKGYMSELYQNQNVTMLHCMLENGEDYYGFSVQSHTDAFGIQGAPGTYFPGHFIDTNTFKFAIVCKKGIIQELRMIRDKGVESYKVRSGLYTQIDKTLVIGCYKDDFGNYDRFWNGTISSLVIYDEALSGGQICNILNTASSIRNNFTPNGEPFIDTVNVNWNTQELYATFNLDTCIGTTECILSFGNNISSWAGNNVHFYYTKSSNRMLIQCMQGGAAQNIEVTASGIMTVIFNSSGLNINGTLYPTSQYMTFSNIHNLNSIQIGSVEGETRSHASNYTINLRTE